MRHALARRDVARDASARRIGAVGGLARWPVIGPARRGSVTVAQWPAIVALALLALLFGLAQQRASLHALSHATAAVHAGLAGPAADRSETGGTGAVEHCEDCLAMAVLAAALPSAEPVVPVARFRTPEAAAPGRPNQRGPPTPAFRSRAPPFPT